MEGRRKRRRRRKEDGRVSVGDWGKYVDRKKAKTGDM
jgi:hypothetical protein